MAGFDEESLALLTGRCPAPCSSPRAVEDFSCSSLLRIGRGGRMAAAMLGVQVLIVIPWQDHSPTFEALIGGPVHLEAQGWIGSALSADWLFMNTRSLYGLWKGLRSNWL